MIEMEEEIVKYGKAFLATILASFFGIIIIQAGTFFHEIAFHNLALRYFGCEEIKSGVHIFTGATSFKGCILTPVMMVIIALVAPIGSFILGLFLWNLHKDALTRVVGLTIMFYSAIPSLAPFIKGGDMDFAIANGFHPVAGWLIFLVANGILFRIVIDEITEGKERLFRF